MFPDTFFTLESFLLATLKPCKVTFKAAKLCCRSSAQLTVNANCRENDPARAGGQELKHRPQSSLLLQQTTQQAAGGEHDTASREGHPQPRQNSGEEKKSP